MVLSLLLLILLGVGIISLPFKNQVYAQSPVVTPTLYCLAPNCPNGTPTITPTQPVSASISPVPSTIISSQPTTVTTSVIPSPSQPCSASSLTSSFQAPAQRGGQGGRGRGRGRDGGNDDRGGFLGGFFKLLLLLLDIIMKLLGSGGLSLPCSPSTGTPSVSGSPSISPAPSSITASVPPTISGTTASPTAGTPPTTGSTAPSNLKPDLGTWGGYATSTTFQANSKVTADWTVTALDCSGGDGSISPWPGFGGYGSSDPNIAQLGNDMDCTNGAATYPAWSEAYPASSVYYNNTMKAGDQMTATVTFQGSGKFATTMTNKTENWTVTAPMSFTASYTPKTAEVILEALGDSSSQQPPVPKFAPLTFSNSTYSTTGQMTPLASGPGLSLMELGSGGSAQVTTSAITGGNFTETFVHK